MQKNAKNNISVFPDAIGERDAALAERDSALTELSHLKTLLDDIIAMKEGYGHLGTCGLNLHSMCIFLASLICPVILT